MSVDDKSNWLWDQWAIGIAVCNLPMKTPEHNGCNSDVILHFACNVCTQISHNYDPDYPTDNKSLSQNGSDNG